MISYFRPVNWIRQISPVGSGPFRKTTFVDIFFLTTIVLDIMEMKILLNNSVCHCHLHICGKHVLKDKNIELSISTCL